MKPTILQSGTVDTTFGEGVEIVKLVNIYGSRIGDHSFNCPFVETQKGVTIGNNCKIQAYSFIYELVTIGDNSFVSHGGMFISDLFANDGSVMGDKSLWKNTTIGNNVSIGTNSTILPVVICDNVVIGAGSVVTKNISESGTYVGNPARKIK